MTLKIVQLSLSLNAREWNCYCKITQITRYDLKVTVENRVEKHLKFTVYTMFNEIQWIRLKYTETVKVETILS